MSTLTVDIGPAYDGLHVVLRGELDLATVDVAREQVMVLAHASTQDVVLDVAGVAFISVAGARLLADAAHACREEGRALRLRGASGQLLRILAVCDLHVETS
jgi:anti-anti-sigma factor